MSSPLKDRRELSSDTFIKPAVSIALHYGFMPIPRIAKEAHHKQTAKAKSAAKRPLAPRSSFDEHLGEFHGALQAYVEHGLQRLPQPVLFYHSNVLDRKRGSESAHLGLQVVGSKKSVAEAMVMKTAFDILSEAGLRNLSVYVNTIGDRESMLRYSRELTAYLRKHIEDMPVQAQNQLKKDPVLALAYLYHKGHPMADEAPRTIEYLSEYSRAHMREVLEFLEMSGIPYEMDQSILGQPGCHCQTLFEIREMPQEDAEPGSYDTITYARGGRYDEFSRKLYRSNIPAAGVIFECKRKGRGYKQILEPKTIRQPKIYFIQFGFEAKLRSLRVLEVLRKARVPVHQSLGSDKLTGQLQYAERLRIPYTLIMGQKEALEDAVIVRNMSSRSQETVPIGMLPGYLRALR